MLDRIYLPCRSADGGGQAGTPPRSSRCVLEPRAGSVLVTGKTWVQVPPIACMRVIHVICQHVPKPVVINAGLHALASGVQYVVCPGLGARLCKADFFHETFLDAICRKLPRAC